MTRKLLVGVYTVGLAATVLCGQPPAAAQAADQGKASDKYHAYCQICHGNEGKGDGPDGVHLNPKPRNFADCAEMAKHGDDEIIKVITHGGDSVGMSENMQAWGGTLSGQEIRDLLKLIRSFCKKD